MAVWQRDSYPWEVRRRSNACLPASLPAFLPSCLPACLHHLCFYATYGLLFRQSLLAAVSYPSERVWFDDRVRRQKRTLHGCHQVRPGQLRDGSMCCVPPRRRFVSSVRFPGCTWLAPNTKTAGLVWRLALHATVLYAPPCLPGAPSQLSGAAGGHVAAAVRIAQVVCAHVHAMALTETGDVYSWTFSPGT